MSRSNGNVDEIVLLHILFPCKKRQLPHIHTIKYLKLLTRALKRTTASH
jgi:hypothetical protein